MRCLFCSACKDVVGLDGTNRRCRCGDSYGWLLSDGRTAVVGGAAVPLALDRDGLEAAVRDAWVPEPDENDPARSPAGKLPEPFQAEVLPLDHPTVQHQKVERTLPVKQGSFGDVLAPDTVLWREVGIDADGMAEFAWENGDEFTRTERGSWMARVAQASFTWEPGIHPKHGAVIFCDRRPPPNWTHMVVRHNTLKPGGGGAVFVDLPSSFLPEHVYLGFRSAYCGAGRGHLNDIFDERVSIALRCWPEGLRRLGGRRVVYDRVACDSFDYCTLPDRYGEQPSSEKVAE